MKRFWPARVVLSAFMAVLYIFGGCSAAGTEQNKSSVQADFRRFISQKEALTRAIAKRHDITIDPRIGDFFLAAQKDDWIATSNLFGTLQAGSGRQEGSVSWLPPALWGPIHDSYGAYEQFRSWNHELVQKFGRQIVESIPSGSIYFGGTDAGRFVVSALTQSHNEGRPFFTLTQNALVDVTYLGYLREMYAAKISIPTPEGAQTIFQDYLKDAQTRSQKNQLREGEEISMVGGQVAISGLTAIMLINERTVRMIMQENPGREFFLEESFPLTGLYPNSIPHGLIFKLTHQPLDHLPPTVIEADRKFWTGQIGDLLGKALLKENTSVSELCSWAEKLYVPLNLKDFAGSRVFLADRQAPQYFSQCRSAIASLYQWRSEQAAVKSESATWLAKEADFAHRQAVALAPFNPTVVWKYVDYLLRNGRTNDAGTLIGTTLKLNPSARMDLDSDSLKTSMANIRKKANELGIRELR